MLTSCVTPADAEAAVRRMLSIIRGEGDAKPRDSVAAFKELFQLVAGRPKVTEQGSGGGGSGPTFVFNLPVPGEIPGEVPRRLAEVVAVSPPAGGESS